MQYMGGKSLVSTELANLLNIFITKHALNIQVEGIFIS